MAPAVDIKEAAAPSAATKNSENAKSMQVLEQQIARLSVSKDQAEINEAALNIATFINGDIMEGDAPVK
jgi:elongation factor 3